ncbi:MAG: nucleotidyltransferase [Candidatus Rifleibacteriota bacterium]
MSEQIDFIKKIAARLDSAGIAYMLTGSLAMTFYATPRMTRDIDLIIEISENSAEDLLALFASDCYIDAGSIARAISTEGMFNIISNEFILKADFIIKKTDEYRQLEFTRRREVQIDGCRIFIVAPEDLIISKLIWGKDSESEMQLRDILNLLNFAKDLDLDYLNFWVERHGLKEYFKKAIKNE